MQYNLWYLALLRFFLFILEAKKIYLVFWYNSGSVVYFFVCFKCEKAANLF